MELDTIDNGPKKNRGGLHRFQAVISGGETEGIRPQSDSNFNFFENETRFSGRIQTDTNKNFELQKN